jgi:hypothetical protein
MSNNGEAHVQSAVLAGAALPPGYGSVNPFVAVRWPGGAPAFIEFVAEVFGASGKHPLGHRSRSTVEG